MVTTLEQLPDKCRVLTEAFELGQLLVRLFANFDTIMASDDAASIAWLNTPNLDLNGRPVERMRTIRGLNDVTNYIDDARARF